MKRALRVITAALVLSMTAGAEGGERLNAIRNKGALTCGIWPVVTGFAAADPENQYRGMDVDVCRAVAAAIFGDPGKVKYLMAQNVAQLKASDDIDIVARRITWSLTRATSNDLMFGPITFYDGQGFMVLRSSTITDAKQLAGAAVCVHDQEAHAETLASYFRASGLTVKAVPVKNVAQLQQALGAHACVAFSADVSLLGAWRAALKDGIVSYRILSEMISKEPLAPLVRQGDDQFFEIVRWSLFAQVLAEEYGITSQNVDDPHEQTESQRFLGRIPGNGAALGLSETWARDIIKTVGNYGEVFDRNVGADSPIKLDRGPNRLWTAGGLMYAPPLR